MSLGQRTKSAPDGTARRIRDLARRAFNERGVATVGVREIARELDLSPGNVSYYYPTKEVLVAALMEEMHAENNAAVARTTGPLDFDAVNAIVRAFMNRDLENQWLMRDVVSLLLAMPSLRPLSKRMHRARQVRVNTMVERLVEAGLLDRARIEETLPRLRQQIITQVFFWVPAAMVAEPDRDPAEDLDAHARAAMALFLPYCTPTGRRRLEMVLKTGRAHR